MAVDLTFERRLTGGRPELTRDRGRFSVFEGSGPGGGWIWARMRRAGVETTRTRRAEGEQFTPLTAL